MVSNINLGNQKTIAIYVAAGAAAGATIGAGYGAGQAFDICSQRAFSHMFNMAGNRDFRDPIDVLISCRTAVPFVYAGMFAFVGAIIGIIIGGIKILVTEQAKPQTWSAKVISWVR